MRRGSYDSAYEGKRQPRRRLGRCSVGVAIKPYRTCQVDWQSQRIAQLEKPRRSRVCVIAARAD